MRRIVAIAIMSLLLSTISPSVYAITSTLSPTAGTKTTFGEEEEVNTDLEETVTVTTKPRTATRTPTKTITPGAAKSMIMEKRKEAKEKFQAEREAFQKKIKHKPQHLQLDRFHQESALCHRQTPLQHRPLLQPLRNHQQ